MLKKRGKEINYEKEKRKRRNGVRDEATKGIPR
jgi:hypothetical protein